MMGNAACLRSWKLVKGTDRRVTTKRHWIPCVVVGHQACSAADAAIVDAVERGWGFCSLVRS